MILKKIEIKTEVVVIEMTLDEAKILKSILDPISEDPYDLYRKYINEMYKQLCLIIPSNKETDIKV